MDHEYLCDGIQFVNFPLVKDNKVGGGGQKSLILKLCTHVGEFVPHNYIHFFYKN